MAKILRMPSERDLPRGKRREFVEELWDYYRRARRPTLQEIADAIAGGYDAFTASKETIRRTMLGKTVPIDGDVADAIFEVFCGRAGIDPNEDRWEESSYDGFTSRRDWWRNLWSRALEAPPPAPVASGSTSGWGGGGGWTPGADEPPF